MDDFLKRLEPFTVDTSGATGSPSAILVRPEGGRLSVARVPRRQFVVPHEQTYAAVWNMVSKTYHRFRDESLRIDSRDAMAMARDGQLYAWLKQRVLPSCSLSYTLKPDNPKDSEQAAIAERLTQMVNAIPRFVRLKAYLSSALWFGQGGAQVRWGRVGIDGAPGVTIDKHIPVHGDKIVWKWHDAGDHPGILVNTALTATDMAHLIDLTPNGPALILKDPYYRDRVVIHEFEPQDTDWLYEGDLAGQIHGVGLRSRCYWPWTMKNEVLAWGLDGAQKTGTNGMIYGLYDASNPAAKREVMRALKRLVNNQFAVVPRDPNNPQAPAFDVIPNSPVLHEVLKMLVDYFDEIMRLAIIGQNLSSEAAPTGLGSAVAELHEDTKMQLIKSDALNLAETIEDQVLKVMIRLNRWQYRGRVYEGRDLPFRVQFVFNVDQPNVLEKLQAAKILQEMGVPLDVESLREESGFKAPETHVEALKPEHSLQMRMPQPPVMALPAPASGASGSGPGGGAAGSGPGPAQQPRALPPVRHESDATPVRYAKDRSADPGVMVALELPDELKDALHLGTVRGAEAKEDLHLTLCYLGRLSKLPEGAGDLVQIAAESLAASWGPLEGTVGGWGRFSATGTTDGRDVIYASADLPGLARMRTELIDRLKGLGLDVAHDHDFTPHITLAYVDAGAGSPVDRIAPLPWKVDRLAYVVGDARQTFPLSGGAVRYAKRAGAEQPRAPKGHPVVINGKVYLGGQWIPASEFAKASPEERRSYELARAKHHAPLKTLSREALVEARDRLNDELGRAYAERDNADYEGPQWKRHQARVATLAEAAKKLTAEMERRDRLGRLKQQDDAVQEGEAPATAASRIARSKCFTKDDDPAIGDWVDEQFGRQMGTLDAREVRALHHWQDDNDVNFPLRGIPRRTSVDGALGYRSVQNYLDAVSSGIAKAEVPADMRVWRGVGWEHVFGDMDPEDIVGKVFVDNGIVACGINPRVSKNFARQAVSSGLAAALFRIFVPKGSKAAVPHLRTRAYVEESELTLDRGARFYIRSIRRQDIGGARGVEGKGAAYLIEAVYLGSEPGALPEPTGGNYGRWGVPAKDANAQPLTPQQAKLAEKAIADLDKHGDSSIVDDAATVAKLAAAYKASGQMLAKLPVEAVLGALGVPEQLAPFVDPDDLGVLKKLASEAHTFATYKGQAPLEGTIHPHNLKTAAHLAYLALDRAIEAATSGFDAGDAEYEEPAEEEFPDDSMDYDEDEKPSSYADTMSALEPLHSGEFAKGLSLLGILADALGDEDEPTSKPEVAKAVLETLSFEYGFVADPWLAKEPTVSEALVGLAKEADAFSYGPGAHVGASKDALHAAGKAAFSAINQAMASSTGKAASPKGGALAGKGKGLGLTKADLNAKLAKAPKPKPAKFDHSPTQDGLLDFLDTYTEQYGLEYTKDSQDWFVEQAKKWFGLPPGKQEDDWAIGNLHAYLASAEGEESFYSHPTTKKKMEAALEHIAKAKAPKPEAPAVPIGLQHAAGQFAGLGPVALNKLKNTLAATTNTQTGLVEALGLAMGWGDPLIDYVAANTDVGFSLQKAKQWYAEGQTHKGDDAMATAQSELEDAAKDAAKVAKPKAKGKGKVKVKTLFKAGESIDAAWKTKEDLATLFADAPTHSEAALLAHLGEKWGWHPDLVAKAGKTDLAYHLMKAAKLAKAYNLGQAADFMESAYGHAIEISGG